MATAAAREDKISCTLKNACDIDHRQIWATLQGRSHGALVKTAEELEQELVANWVKHR